MAGVTGRVLAWAGGVIAVAIAAGLGVYFVVVGLDKADKLASVAGAFIGVAALVASVFGLVEARAAAAREAGQSVAGSKVGCDVIQLRGAAASRGKQVVKDTEVSGSVIQAWGVGGDFHYDR